MIFNHVPESIKSFFLINHYSLNAETIFDHPAIQVQFKFDNEQ